MKILISPAKSIQTHQELPSVSVSKALFLEDSEKLVKKLQKYSAKKLAALFHVSVDIAELNYHRFQNWQSPISQNEEIQPAVFAFTGEVYRGLNVKNLDNESLNYLNDHLFILSGLYGILKPFDLMYPYRLEMGTKFPYSSKITNLYQFWGDKLTNKLNQEEQDVIVNLASAEYYKSIQEKKLKAKVITPVFKEFKNGKYQLLMTYAKHARGSMTRFCAEKKIEKVEDLKLFQVDGYQYMENMSTETEWVFVR
jgi:cytoplasmic iron level regulating protein YaaA (DUF328/UPF0246 family)